MQPTGLDVDDGEEIAVLFECPVPVSVIEIGIVENVVPCIPVEFVVRSRFENLDVIRLYVPRRRGVAADEALGNVDTACSIEKTLGAFGGRFGRASRFGVAHGSAFLGADAPHIEQGRDEDRPDPREPSGIVPRGCESIRERVKDDAPVRLAGTAEDDDVAGDGAGVAHRTPQVPKDVAHGRQSPPAHVWGLPQLAHGFGFGFGFGLLSLIPTSMQEPCHTIARGTA